MNGVRTVLLLGAGFSKSAGLPLMDELWAAVHAEAARRLSAGEKQLAGHVDGIEVEIDNIDRMARKCALGGGYDTDKGPADIELFLTTLEEIREAGRAGFVRDDHLAAWRARKALVCWVCLAIDRICDDARARSDGLAAQARILGALEAGDAVVTLNYDTLAESGLECAGLGWRYAGATGAAAITVCKPHGSLNWSWMPAAVPVHQKVWTWYTEGAYSVGSLAGHRLGFHDRAVSTDGDSALIVAPTRRKVAGAPFLQSQIAEAIAALAEAEALVVVGYSLPEHDDLIATALRTGALLSARRRGGDLPALVVDPNSEVAGKYAALGLAAKAVADRLENFAPAAIGATRGSR